MVTPEALEEMIYWVRNRDGNVSLDQLARLIVPKRYKNPKAIFENFSRFIMSYYDILISYVKSDEQKVEILREFSNYLIFNHPDLKEEMTKVLFTDIVEEVLFREFISDEFFVIPEFVANILGELYKSYQKMELFDKANEVNDLMLSLSPFNFKANITSLIYGLDHYDNETIEDMFKLAYHHSTSKSEMLRVLGYMGTFYANIEHNLYASCIKTLFREIANQDNMSIESLLDYPFLDEEEFVDALNQMGLNRYHRQVLEKIYDQWADYYMETEEYEFAMYLLKQINYLYKPIQFVVKD